MTSPLVLSWSGGKDCLAALDLLRGGAAETGGYDLRLLVASVARGRAGAEPRVPIHELPLSLLERQTDALGTRLRTIELPPSATNEVYEAAWLDLLAELRREFATGGEPAIAYGDLFLADIREYRERRVSRAGWQALFPLWNSDTDRLARDFIERGYRAIVTSVDAARLDESFAGELYTAEFLARLPHGVDPCGERGEFHTFVFDGPLFRREVEFALGAVERRGAHHVCELRPR